MKGRQQRFIQRAGRKNIPENFRFGGGHQFREQRG
jgi:hypothetical protein